jgi:hypothetical protein
LISRFAAVPELALLCQPKLLQNGLIALLEVIDDRLFFRAAGAFLKQQNLQFPGIIGEGWSHRLHVRYFTRNNNQISRLFTSFQYNS